MDISNKDDNSSSPDVGIPSGRFLSSLIRLVVVFLSLS